MNAVFAHTGHWLVSVAYAAPVVVLVGWLLAVRIKDNRTRRREEA